MKPQSVNHSSQVQKIEIFHLVPPPLIQDGCCLASPGPYRTQGCCCLLCALCAELGSVSSVSPGTLRSNIYNKWGGWTLSPGEPEGDNGQPSGDLLRWSWPREGNSSFNILCNQKPPRCASLPYTSWRNPPPPPPLWFLCFVVWGHLSYPPSSHLYFYRFILSTSHLHILHLQWPLPASGGDVWLFSFDSRLSCSLCTVWCIHADVFSLVLIFRGSCGTSSIDAPSWRFV